MNRPWPIVAPGWISMPVSEAVELADPARHERHAGVAQLVRQAVQPQGVQAGVRGDDLELGRGGGVALLHRLDVAGDLVDGRVHVAG